MCLMCYVPIHWLEMDAMRVEGTTSRWANAVLKDVTIGYKLMFHTPDKFNKSMVQWFEPVMEIEEARK